MSIVFSSLHRGIVVSQDAAGSYSWSGGYDGASIKQAIPIDQGERCVLLLDPDASQHSVFENLLCIDRKGKTVWSARLPTSPDVFLEITPDDAGIFAKTWSGLVILFDWNSGMELKRNFVK